MDLRVADLQRRAAFTVFGDRDMVDLGHAAQMENGAGGGSDADLGAAPALGNDYTDPAVGEGRIALEGGGRVAHLDGLRAVGDLDAFRGILERREQNERGCKQSHGFPQRHDPA